MLKGSPQWRHMITRRSGLAPPPSPSGGAILRTPDTRCLILSTRARRLSSITAPSLISSQSSSRKGQWSESARFWPSSLRRRLSFSDKLVSGWKRMTRGKPCNDGHVSVGGERAERQSCSTVKKVIGLKTQSFSVESGLKYKLSKILSLITDNIELEGEDGAVLFSILKNLIPETEDHRPFQDWIKVFSPD